MAMRRLLLVLLTVVAAAGLLTGCGAAAGRQVAVKAAPPPPTVMDSPGCRPPPQHPEPVVLIHGTFAATSWQLIGPALARRGYCVFTFNYGDYGTGEITLSAHELAGFVDRVLARTHAQRVSIVGHSEGGMMPRYYIRFLGGASKVDDLIALSPSNHGTENPMVLEGAAMGCLACAEQQAFGSPFLSRLNAGDEARGPVDYTVIQTAYDGVVTPYASAFLRGPAARVTDVTLQHTCPGDLTGHLGIPTDPVALQWIENALGRPGPANPAFRPRCS
jgi:triacylglycerol lipase